MSADKERIESLVKDLHAYLVDNDLWGFQYRFTDGLGQVMRIDVEMVKER